MPISRSWILALFLIMTASWTPAASGRGLFRKLNDGVAVQLDSATVRLRVCDPRTIRVMVLPRGVSGVRPSLVVTRKWSPVRWRANADGDDVVLNTDSLAARVNLTTGSVRFYDRKNALIMQERPEHPHEIVSATVSGEKTWHVACTFRPGPEEGLYGLGQFEYGIMNYRNRHVTLIQNNRHVCVPLLVSSRGYGIYWDNYSQTEFNDGPGGSVLWSEVGDGIDYYFYYGGNLDAVIAEHREATGRVPMFPEWAFGYWQSKERYENQNELMSVAREYRKRKLPVDNIVQDWQYWGRLGWNAMAFDDSLYPDPRGMIDSLHNLYNMHIMISIWPQVDSSTAVYRDLKAAGHLFPTEIWNGGKTYDAYSTEARDIYWKHLNSGLYSKGIDAWWVDATEPDWKWCDSLLEEKEGIVKNGMTAIGSSSRYLNTYALMTTGGMYKNQRTTNPNRRVVMLTRSAFAGQQRNSMSIWSGDISSNWKTFRNQIAGGVNFSMAGIPYWNSDIGGFLPKEYGGEYPLGNRDSAYCELYVRWFQFGAFCPVFRAHGTDFPREIWQFGEPGTWAYDALVKYDRLRYRLLPYIYSVGWKVTGEHYTMMRGLPMDFAHDPKTYGIDNEYMFGPAFLVAPVTAEMYYPKNKAVLIPSSNMKTAANKPGLTGQYFRGLKFDTLDHVQRDSVIRFDWTDDGAPGVGKTQFTVRWDGKVLAPETGTYQFEITSDDGVNLWVNGQQIMDEMYPAGLQMNFGEIALQAGIWYDVTLEYQQVDKGAEISFGWRTPSMIASYTPNHGIQSSRVYLPDGAAWYDFWTGAVVNGGKDVDKPAPVDIMPLYVRAGSILPMGPDLQFSSEKPADPLEVRVYRGADGTFGLYEDETDGYGYEKGKYAIIPMRWNEKARTLTLGARTGSFPGMLRSRTFRIVWVGATHGVGVEPTATADRVITYDGREVNVTVPR